jgi:hypothetical protein
MRHEADELKSLRKEVQRLKIALVDRSLAYDALETLLEVSGIDQAALKKTSGCRHCAMLRKAGKERKRRMRLFYDKQEWILQETQTGGQSEYGASTGDRYDYSGASPTAPVRAAGSCITCMGNSCTGYCQGWVTTGFSSCCERKACQSLASGITCTRQIHITGFAVMEIY